MLFNVCFTLFNVMKQNEYLPNFILRHCMEKCRFKIAMAMTVVTLYMYFMKRYTKAFS